MVYCCLFGNVCQKLQSSACCTPTAPLNCCCCYIHSVMHSSCTHLCSYACMSVLTLGSCMGYMAVSVLTSIRRQLQWTMHHLLLQGPVSQLLLELSAYGAASTVTVASQLTTSMLADTEGELHIIQQCLTAAAAHLQAGTQQGIINPRPKDSLIGHQVHFISKLPGMNSCCTVKDCPAALGSTYEG